jgi:hypothetical protein
MRFSNRKAVLWLLKNGYDEIWLKPHIRRTDLVYTAGEWYRALDLWNLFDGICFNDGGDLILIQIKTNAWASAKPISDWLKDKNNLIVLVINVKGKGKKWDVMVRKYENKQEGTIHRKGRSDSSSDSKRPVRSKGRLQDTS